MSEIKLNVIDAENILVGTIHGSDGERCVAALSAEPETIAELEAALARYVRRHDHHSVFSSFRSWHEIDERPWDAGILVIDLAARAVASESTYSQPGPTGEVCYHDSRGVTDVSVVYRLAEDWLFLDSIEQYQFVREERCLERASNPPLDARSVLYGRPLLEFIARESMSLIAKKEINIEATSVATGEVVTVQATRQPPFSDADCDCDTGLHHAISELHARWLMTPRDDLRGQSPRDVLFARRDYVDFDLESRAMQWSLQGEGPPCLNADSRAYRFAGFGTHEWVVYYDLVRKLIWSLVAPNLECGLEDQVSEAAAQVTGKEARLNDLQELEAIILRLDQVKTAWLEAPEPEYDERTPAIIVDNERRRLPVAMRPRDMIIDQDCPMCQLMADETAGGSAVGFWHLDGSHMDDDFVFSCFATREEWETERRNFQEFMEKFNCEWESREQQLSTSEVVDS